MEKNWKKGLLAVLVIVLAFLVYQDMYADTASKTLTLAVSSSSSIPAPLCGITNETGALVPPASAWTNFTPPAVGDTYVDTTASGDYCPVTRITNIGSGGQMIPFYSLVQAISASDDMLLLYNGDAAHWNIYNFTGGLVISGTAFNTATSINNSQPRWDRFTDNVIWVTSGNTLKKCTIAIGVPGSISCAVSHAFTEYAYSVVFPGDTDMNENGWVPMVGQNVNGSSMDIFMFQPNTNTKAGTYTESSSGCTGDGNSMQPGCIHRLISTPNNGMTIEGPTSPGGDSLWLPPFSGGPVAWNPSADHHSVGYEIDGSTPTGVFEDFDNANTGGPCDFRPVVVSFANTSLPGNCPITPPGTVNPPPEFGWHVSYMDHAARSWVVWSMMGNGTAPENFNSEAAYAAPLAWNASGGNWYPYQAEIVMVRVDSNVTSVGEGTSLIYRLALSHARQHADSGYYWQDVYAPVSWDGKYVVFSSNAAFAQSASGCPADSSGSGFTGDCADTYLIGPLF